MPGALAVDAPPAQFGRFVGPQTTIQTMIAQIRGPRGERSVLVRGMAEHAVRGLADKDYQSEILAVRNFVAERVRYANDPLRTEWTKDPQRMAEEIRSHGRAVGDCFPAGTLVLDDAHRLRRVEDLVAGDRIWGLDEWSRVEATAYKGVLPVDVLTLNNGSQLKLTPDHHVYVNECEQHGAGRRTDRLRACDCPASRFRERRVRVSEVEEGMLLPAPQRVPFGSGEMDPDRAYIEGLYVSDGWCENNRFAISGQDDSPKERQKDEVVAICARLGLPTYRARKYVRINDPEWARSLHGLGFYAPEKRVRTLDMDEAYAAATLRGVMADSGRNTHGAGRTFTTTSRLLAVQTRVLHRMFGITCGWSHIEDHGGLGSNPIWRLGVRGRDWRLRVKRIERSVAELPCWDIQTSDHRVYLPEHDVTVSQCDDIASFIVALCNGLGREGELVTVGFRAPGHYSHVFARIKEPKTGRWIVCDPVAGSDEASMLRRVRTYKIWRIDT